MVYITGFIYIYIYQSGGVPSGIFYSWARWVGGVLVRDFSVCVCVCVCLCVWVFVPGGSSSTQPGDQPDDPPRDAPSHLSPSGGCKVYISLIYIYIHICMY